MIVAQPGSDLGIPTNISGLAFGGEDGRTLYITGAGTYRLYRVELPVTDLRLEVVDRFDSGALLAWSGEVRPAPDRVTRE